MPWHNGLLVKTYIDEAFISVVFTWQLQEAYQRAVWLAHEGYEVVAGGPAVKLMPDFLAEVAELPPECGELQPLIGHNPDATFTSRGCIRKCPFCAVPKIEGDLVEFNQWPIRPIICDNNLLACSRKHFDTVIDWLKPVRGVDFNQGLDARLLTKHHADRLAELDCTVRLAWDDTKTGNSFMTAYERLRKAHIPKSRIQCYVLIGFNDTPDDALFRLRTIHNLGIMPNPMRYNPLDAMERDSYVAPNWTERELTRFMRYWANLRYTAAVPFEEFDESAPRVVGP